MSLYNQEGGSPGAWGTIYSQGREHSLGNIEHARSTAWTPEDEAAYLARVRERAGQMATQLLADARREAEAIKKKAREEGYAMGLENARAELEEFRSGMGEAVSAVLGAIEGQCSQIFQDWREDVVAVARLCVEKISAVELSENRQAVLDALLSESVAVLEQRKRLVIRVNPEDEAMLSDIVGLAQERFPDVQAWRVKGDPSISPGGMVVESESSLAEGRLESRIAAVDGILANLALVDGAMPETGAGQRSAPAAQAKQQAEPAAQPRPETAAAQEPAEPEPGNALAEAERQSAPEAGQPEAGPADASGLVAAPGELPGLDLSDPNLSQEDINAALEAMLATQNDDANN